MPAGRSSRPGSILGRGLILPRMDTGARSPALIQPAAAGSRLGSPSHVGFEKILAQLRSRLALRHWRDSQTEKGQYCAIETRTSASPKRPMWAPTFDFGTVVILSTIRRQAVRNPLSALGSTSRRKRGASVSSVVRAQMVIEFVASKRSSCRMTTGRGLPA